MQITMSALHFPGVRPESVCHEDEWRGRPYERRKRQIQVSNVLHLIKKLQQLLLCGRGGGH